MVKKLLEKVASGSEDMSIKDFKHVFYLYAHEKQYCEIFFTHPLMTSAKMISSHKIKEDKDWGKLENFFTNIVVDTELLEIINTDSPDPVWVISMITGKNEHLSLDTFKFILSLYNTERFKHKRFALMSRMFTRRDPKELELVWYSMGHSAYDHRMKMLVENDFKKHEIPLNILVETALFYEWDERYQDYFQMLYSDSKESFKEDLIKYATQFVDEEFPTDVPLEWLIELVTPFALENIRTKEESLKKYSCLRGVC